MLNINNTFNERSVSIRLLERTLNNFYGPIIIVSHQNLSCCSFSLFFCYLFCQGGEYQVTTLYVTTP